MKSDINQVSFSGMITDEPNSRTFDNGSCLISFVVCSTIYWKIDGDYKPQKTFLKCETRNQCAKMAHRELKKGMKVRVDGRLVFSEKSKEKTKDGYKDRVEHKIVFDKYDQIGSTW